MRMTLNQMEELKPGQYCRIAEDLSFWASLSCPRCGKRMCLSKSVHTVRADGTVSPRVACPHKCKWIASVVLAGWNS